MAYVQRSGRICGYKFNLKLLSLTEIALAVGLASLQNIANYCLAGIAGDKKIDEPRARDFDFINRVVAAYLPGNQVCQITWRLCSLLCQHHRNIAGKITLAAILARSHLDIGFKIGWQLFSFLKTGECLLNQIVNALLQVLKPVLIAVELTARLKNESRFYMDAHTDKRPSTLFGQLMHN